MSLLAQSGPEEDKVDSAVVDSVDACRTTSLNRNENLKSVPALTGSTTWYVRFGWWGQSLFRLSVQGWKFTLTIRSWP